MSSRKWAAEARTKIANETGHFLLNADGTGLPRQVRAAVTTSPDGF
jgi:hypothetical protein